MEKQIKQLAELANRYYDFAVKMELKDGTHNVLRGHVLVFTHLDTYSFTVESNDDKEIRVYLADDRKTKAINFGEVEFTEWTNKVSFPIDFNSSDLQLIYEDALLFLEDHLYKFITD